MATLRDLRNRIKGVQNTQKITRAMKMVASAKLKRAKKRILDARPYAYKIHELMNHLASDEYRANNPYLTEREVNKICIVVVTADRGLCGAFNSNILKQFTAYADELAKEREIPYVVYPIGKKASEFMRRQDYPVYESTTDIFSDLHFEDSLDAAQMIIQGYLKHDFDKVVVIYNEFKSVIQQNVIVEQYLPIPYELHKVTSKKESEEQEDDEHKGDGIDYIYEPSQREIFEYLLPRHLNTQMWRMLLESNAAELGARMTAMDNATSNADDIIHSLRRTYNKERQAAITTEILEVVSGANALEEN